MESGSFPVRIGRSEAAINNLIAIIGEIDCPFTTNISAQVPLPIAKERVEGPDCSRLQTGRQPELSAGRGYQASIPL
jgi:hypothetical protein